MTRTRKCAIFGWQPDTYVIAAEVILHHLNADTELVAKAEDRKYWR